MNYAHIIREHLARSGMSVEEFAAQAKISRATTFRILAGHENLELKTLRRALSIAGYSLAAVPVSAPPPPLDAPPQPQGEQRDVHDAC